MEYFEKHSSREFLDNKLKYSLHLIDNALNFFDKIGILYEDSLENQVLLDIIVTFFKKFKEKLYIFQNTFIVLSTENKKLKDLEKRFEFVKFNGENLENKSFLYDSLGIRCIITQRNFTENEDKIIYNNNGILSTLCPLLNWDSSDYIHYALITKL